MGSLSPELDDVDEMFDFLDSQLQNESHEEKESQRQAVAELGEALCSAIVGVAEQHPEWNTENALQPLFRLVQCNKYERTPGANEWPFRTEWDPTRINLTFLGDEDQGYDGMDELKLLLQETVGDDSVAFCEALTWLEHRGLVDKIC